MSPELPERLFLRMWALNIWGPVRTEHPNTAKSAPDFLLYQNQQPACKVPVYEYDMVLHIVIERKIEVVAKILHSTLKDYLLCS